MKKILSSLIVIFIFSGITSADDSRNVVKSNSFELFGKYTETLEYNSPSDTLENEEESCDELFEEEALKEVLKRYEERETVLKPDYDSDDNAPFVSVFKLKINKESEDIQTKIKNENMIYDGSKLYSRAFMHASKRKPILPVVNRSKLTAEYGNGFDITLGQPSLYDFSDIDILFTDNIESSRDTGGVIGYNGRNIGIASGFFTSTEDFYNSAGAVITSKMINLPRGNFRFGAAGGAREADNGNILNGGLFTEYGYNRLKLNVQTGKTKTSSQGLYETGVYFIPEIRLTDSLSLKTRFSNNLTQNSIQDELILSYSPVKSRNSLKLEINASNFRSDNKITRQRLKVSASFKF